MRLFKFLILMGLSLTLHHAVAQDDPSKDLLQLSGVVVSGDSLTPVPFTSVIIKGSNRGTICDYFGFFSLVVRKNDTIQFRSLGYTEAEVIVDDTLSDTRYSMIQMLQRDTLTLPATDVYPWPSKEQFRDAFLSLNTTQDDYDRAFANLTNENIRMALNGTPTSAQANSSLAIQREYTRLYQQGQMPSGNLLNPLAWAQFVDAWKKGKFKK